MAVIAVAAALAWNMGALALGVVSLAPAPNARLWLLGLLVQGSSLLLVGAGAAGIGLASVAALLGAEAVWVVAADAGFATMVLGAVPVGAGVGTARTAGVRLSLRHYVARPAWTARRPRRSLVFTTPSDAPDGLALDVLAPRGTQTGPRPAVVLVHGGGWVGGQRGGIARWNEWLADQGYVVFDVDYRLAPPARWCDAPDDVRTAINWIRNHADDHGVNPNRVAIVGWSAGGHLALLTAYTGTERPVTAVAAFYADTDLTALPAQRRPRWASAGAAEHLTAFLGAPPADVPERAAWASPITHVGPAAPPTLLVHGRADQFVAPAQSARLAALLTSAAVPVERVQLPLANHSFDLSWGAWSTQIARARLGAFLARHLATA
jgi:acetyl esterase/lipase